MPGLRPEVTPFDTAILLSESIAVSELFSVSDPDGDPITEYVIRDGNSANSGFLVFQGVVQANGAELTISADDLDELFYVGSPTVANELVQIQASDGTLLSSPSLVRVYTARQESVRPIAQVDNVSVLGNESILASSFISAADPDGFPILSYNIRDREDDRSFFSLDGDAIPQGEFRIYSAAEFARLRYNGVGRRSENIDVFAFDGTINSVFATGIVEVQANLNRPVVNFASEITVQDELIPVAPLVDYFDADGNTIKFIDIRDRNSRSFSGSLVFRGEDLAPGEFHQFTPDELDEVFFRGGERNITEQLRYRVGDGRFRSGIATIALENVAGGGGNGDGPNVGAPELTATNSGINVQEQLFFVPINDLTTQSDDGFPATSYEVIDANGVNNSASIWLNGNRQASGTVLTFTDEQYETQLEVRSGVFDNRHYDEIYVRADNGNFQSSWTRQTFYTEPEYLEAFQRLQATGAVVPTWDFFVPTQGNEPLELTFSFIQQLPDYERGEAEEAPNRQPTPREFFQFTDAQRIATRSALEHIETFTNIRFTEVPDSPQTVDPVSGNRGGTLRFGNYYRALAPQFGGAAPMAADNGGPGCFTAFGAGTTPQSGDLWFNVDRGGLFPFYTNNDGVPAISSCNGLDYLGADGDPNVDVGTFEYDLLLAGIGVNLGLGAPVDFIGPADQNPILPLATQNDQYTVLLGGFSPDPVTGYQLYDVNYLQTIYGANNSFNLGNDTYSIFENLTFGASSRQTIWDAGGIDTLSAVGSTNGGALVDLRPGFFSAIGAVSPDPFLGIEGNISIAFGAEIENAVGSNNNDTIFGNELDNRIIGGNGNDFIRGNGGDDVITGGAGADTFAFTIADGDNRINEQQLAGRDRLEFINIPGLDAFDLSDDFTFRLEGRDLVVQLTLDGSPVADTTVTIEEQTRGAFQVESLVLGTTVIDLVNLTDQATGANERFQITAEATIFGNLVAPV